MEPLQMQVVNGLADLGSPDLDDLAADSTYLVTMVVVGVACLILRRALEAVAYDQSQFHEQAQRVVERGAADRKLVFLRQQLAQFLDGEMAVYTIYSLQYLIAFHRLAMVVHLEIIVQNALHCRQHIFVIHCCLHKPKRKITYFFSHTQAIIYKKSKKRPPDGCQEVSAFVQRIIIRQSCHT